MNENKKNRIQSIIQKGISAGYAVSDAYMQGRLSPEQAIALQAGIQTRMDYLLQTINQEG